MKKVMLNFVATGILFLLFILLIISVLMIDVKPIGPENSIIGLSTLNKAIWNYLRVNMIWYYITDWIGVVAIAFAFGFAIFGLVQLTKRKSIKKVDLDIIILGISYLLTIGCYLFFELVVINYRPIILGKSLAASFPSSTTFIVVSIMGTAILQFNNRFKQHKALKAISITVSVIILSITIIGRQLSGVHWFTDILGGVLLGSFIIMLYYSLVNLIAYKSIKRK